MCSCHQAFVLSIFQEEWPQLAAVMRMMICVVNHAQSCAVVQQVMLQHHILLQAHILLIEVLCSATCTASGWAHDHTLIKPC